MWIVLVILLVCNTLQVILYFHAKNKKPNVYGSIIMQDKNSMYVELDDYDSLHKISMDEYATFRVKKTHQ